MMQDEERWWVLLRTKLEMKNDRREWERGGGGEGGGVTEFGEWTQSSEVGRTQGREGKAKMTLLKKRKRNNYNFKLTL